MSLAARRAAQVADERKAEAAQVSVAEAAKVLLDALGDIYNPRNRMWAKIIDEVSREPDVTRVRGSDGILIALRALSVEPRRE